MTLRTAALRLSLALLVTAACSVDLGAIPCSNDLECATGSFCAHDAGTTGTCAVGAGPQGCGIGLTACDGGCANTNNDEANCGMCGHLCVAPAGGSTTCNLGGCIPHCPNPQVLDGGACITIVTNPPDAPTGLVAVGGVNEITLSWQGSAGATGYNLKRSLVPGGPYAKLGTTLPANPTQTTDNTVSTGTTYYYVVTAVGAGGESPPSAQASGLTAPDLPGAVSAIGGTNSVALSWNRVAGASSYNVYTSAISGMEMLDSALSPHLDPGSGTSINVSDSPLPNGAQRFYKIEAVNGSGSARSGEVSAITALPAPTSLTATAGASSITLQWNSVTDATTYALLRDVDGGFAVIDSNAVSPEVDTNVLPGVQYQYQVEAVTSAATSAPGNTATAQTTLGVPANLGGSAGVRSVSLHWDTVPGETGFDLARSTDGAAFLLLNTQPISANNYTDNSVSPGTAYAYQVRALAGPVQGAFSSSFPLVTALDSPGSVNIGLDTSTNTITLNWSQTDDNKGYDLKRSTDGVNYALIGATRPTTNNLTYSESNLTPGFTYYYSVATWTPDAISDPQLRQASIPLAPPSGLSLVSNQANAVQITWTGSPGATSYKIFAAAGSAGSFAQIGTSTGASYTDATALGAHNYRYEVFATNGAVTSAASAPLTVNTNLTTPSPIAVDPITGRVVWTPSSGATGYNVQRSTDGAAYSPINGNNPSLDVATACTGQTVSACSYGETQTATTGTIYYEVQAYGVNGVAVTSLFSVPVGVFTGVQPVPPANLLAPSLTATSVLLSWNKVQGFKQYNLLRSTSASGPFVRLGGIPTINIGNQSQGFYYDCDLSPGTTYYYQLQINLGITAVGAPTSFAPITLPTTNLTSPGHFTAAPDSAQGMVFGWDAVSGANLYNIYESDDLGATWTQLMQSNVNSATYQYQGLPSPPLQVAVYMVEAVQNVPPLGYSALSAPVSAFLPIPTPPAGLTATAGAGASPSTNLSWGSLPGASSYNVYRSLDGHTWSMLANVATTPTTYTDSSSLTYATKYYYAVSNLNGFGESPKSEVATVVTASPPQPTGLTIAAQGGVPTLSWNSVASLPSNAGYIVARSADGTTFSPIGSSPFNTTSTQLSDVTVPSNGTWYYQVGVWAPGIQGIAFSSPASIAISANAAPGSFTASAITPTAVTLVWSDSAGLIGTEVVRSSDGASSFIPLGALPTVGQGVLKYVDPNVQPGTVYQYRVAGAVNVNQFTLPSAVFSVVTAPGGLHAAGGSGEVTLAWNAVPGATGYSIYRGPSNGNPPGGQTPYRTLSTNSYTDVGLADGTWFYAVSASVPGIPDSVPSAAVSATAGSGGVIGTATIDNFTLGTGGTQEVTTPVDLTCGVACTITAWYQQGGSWSSSVAVGTADGHFAIPNVPQGEYLLLYGTGYYATSARTIDLGTEEFGRINVQHIKVQPTNLNLSLTGLVAENPLDIFETFSMNGRNNFFELVGPNSPKPGTTSISGLVDDTFSSFGNTLVDGSQGDDLTFYQLATKLVSDTVGVMHPVQTMSRAAMLTAPVQQDGVDSSASGAMTTPSTNFSLMANYRRSAYQAYWPQMNPQMVDGNAYAPSNLFIDAQPGAGAGRGQFGSAGNPDLLEITLPPLFPAPDINLGAVAFGDPFDPSWTPWGGTNGAAIAMTVLLPGQTVGRDVVFNALTRDTLPALNALGASSAGLSPRLSPALQMEINGVSAFYEVSGVGTTPTISWQPPATGTPTFYQVRIYRLVPNGVAVRTVFTANLNTTDTQITLPPGIITVVPGTAFLAVIYADTLPGYTTDHPLRTASLRLDIMPTISAKFFP